MHGCSLVSTLLVNAEVDSMGGVIDSGAGIDTKTSPRRAAIEKVQSDLRLEYDVREERRRELEFLEKGGDPLDFKFGLAASVSFQSASVTDHQGLFGTSEAKGSFALATSPKGDSVESSGRLTTTLAGEPNSADNFDGDNELHGSERKSKYSRSCVTPPEHSSQPGSQNARDMEDSPTFQPRKAYKRRYRSKPNRDNVRSAPIHIASRGGDCSSLPIDSTITQKTVMQESPVDAEMDYANATVDVPVNGSLSEINLDISSSQDVQGNVDKQGNVDRQNTMDVGEPVLTSAETDFVIRKEHILPPSNVSGECPPCSVVPTSNKPSDHEHVVELNNNDENRLQTEGVVCNLGSNVKGLDSESSCTRTSISIDANGNSDNDLRASLKIEDSNGEPGEQKVASMEPLNSKDVKVLDEKNITNVAQNEFGSTETSHLQSHQAMGFVDESEEVMNKSRHSDQSEEVGHPNVKEMQSDQLTELVSETKNDVTDDSNAELQYCLEKTQRPEEPAVSELTNTHTTVAHEHQPCKNNPDIPVDKVLEDQILEEAQLIEAKRKRIAESTVVSHLKEYRRKTQWDFVLEEMLWLANDFAQERVWKRTAAAQMGQQAAFASCLRLEESHRNAEQKSIAHALSKAVLKFWDNSVLLLKQIGQVLVTNEHDTAVSRNIDGVQSDSDEMKRHDEDMATKEGLQICRKNVQGYALRFLQHNGSVLPLKSGYCEFSEDSYVTEIPEVTYQSQFAGENLFYVIPHGAIQAYRNSIEICLAQSEKTGRSLHEEVDTSMYEPSSEFDLRENEYEEDEGENTNYLPGAFERSKSSKFFQKKRKTPKTLTPKSYQVGGNFSSSHDTENKHVTSLPTTTGRRLPNGLNVGPIPTKRVRTASRQRVVGPFNGGSAGIIPAPNRADASSGDTNSFQDDQSSLHGSSYIPKGSEVESGMDYDKQLTYDTEISAKPKKKKKTKHQAVSYDHRWQLDSNMQCEQRDNQKRRLDNHQFESYGSSGMFGTHGKKLKLMKQSMDNSFENATHMSGSIASPAASQMSNMSSPNKLIKLIGGRDRGRKTKGPKLAAGQPGSGSPWSLIEDQALVVLVHDMGPYWELVSDAINSTLQFKCIFRTPKECKERHKALMDMSSGDGADSAEDSGSSQPYPSTLPGIPKGSARQLFQHLRGPMEEDTIRSHFEKIMLIGQRLRSRKKQEPKQPVAVHGSHAAALMQVLPNNVNGGVLTPLDLCDTTVSSPEVFSLGYQGPHSGGLSLANLGASQSMPSSGPNTSLQGSPGVAIGTNVASSSAQLNGFGGRYYKDGRYGAPGAGLPNDENQRIQHYNHMMSGRNLLQPNMSLPGAISGSGRGVRMFPGANGIGMIPGMNRNLPMSPRPGIQGMPSPSMVNSGSIGIPNSVNMHSGTSPGRANSMIRPREALHMSRPGQNIEHPRQMMSPEMQMQASQAGAPPSGGLNPTFPSQSNSSPSVASYPAHHQQHHPTSQHSSLLNNSHHSQLHGPSHMPTPEQQAFAVRLARDRQLQQKMLQRQQQQQQHQHQQQHPQFPTSNAVMSHPTSTSLPNSPHMQTQASSQSASMPPSVTPSSPMTPVSAQQKHPQPHHGLGQTSQTGAGVLINQGAAAKQQRQRQTPQPLQQSSRQHPQQRQPNNLQPQQQAKLMKGIGRGNNVSMHQNVDASQLAGLPGNSSGGQAIEKGEQSMHVMQGQGYPMRPSKSVSASISGVPHSQQKLAAGSVPAPSKQVQQMNSRPGWSNQSQVLAVSSNSALSTSDQGLSHSLTPSLNNVQQLKAHPQAGMKLMNHNNQPSFQRPGLQNRAAKSDTLLKPPADHGQTEQSLASKPLSMSPCTTGLQPENSEPSNSGLACDPVVSSSSSHLGPTGRPAVMNSTGNGGRNQFTKQQEAPHQPASSDQQMPCQPQIPEQLQQLKQTSLKQPPLKLQAQSQVQASQSSSFAKSSPSLE